MSAAECENGAVEEPLLSVVKGDPTPDELAAVVSAVAAKLSARPAPGDDSPRTQPTSWAAYWRTVQQPIHPGPGAWRRSALPR